MAEIDTSSYNTNPPSGINQLEGMVNLKAGLQNNQIRGLDLQGQQGLAALYQNAPKDADGNPDTNYIIQNSSQAGVHAPAAIQGALAIQNSKLQVQQNLLKLSGDQLNLGKNINDAIVSTTAPMVKDISDQMRNGTYDPDKMRKAVVDAGLNVVAASMGPDGKPVVTPQSIASMLGSLPFDDPMALQKALVNKQSQAQAWDGHIQDALTLKRGETSQQQVGPGTQNINTSLYTGEAAPAGPVVPTGTSFMGGKTQYNTAAVAPSNPFSPQNPNNPNNAVAPSNPGKPNVPGSPGTSIQGAPTSQAPTTTEQPLPQMPPGYDQNLHSGLDRANEAIQHANDVTPLAAPLKGVIQLADAGGPKEALYNNFKGALADNPILGGLFDKDKSDVVKYEILSKFASDVTGQNMSSNAKNQIESAVQGLSNPNSAQFPQAIRTIGKFLLARTDAAKAYGNAMSAVVGDPNVSPSKITATEKDWRDHYDQNLYELPYMTADEKQNLIGGMSTPERKKFIQNGRFLAQQGLLNPDDLQ